jgi:DNA-3-methyladenine glycosylase II
MPNRAALAHLSKDPVMRRLIRRVGPCGLAVDRRSPYEALVRAVTYQQLNGRAAETILGRVIACCNDSRFPAPATVLGVRAATLRRAGLSRAKTLAIKDIARHAAAGKVPTRRATARMGDEEIIEQLTAIRGVGRWTVEMLLMFTLGRPDVLPVDDFGVREGYRAAYRLKVQPSLNALREYGERWKPYRSTAAWYLWRAAEQARQARRQAARR